MLSNHTKYLLKLCRGWSSVEVARHYGVAESTVNRRTWITRPTPVITIPPPLFSGKHYSELTYNDLSEEEKRFYEGTDYRDNV